MKSFLRSFAVVVTFATVVLVSKPARSDQALAFLGPTGGTVSTTTSGLLLVGTTGAVVYFVFIKKDDKGTHPNNPPATEVDAGGGYVMGEEEAEQWVELYLRDHAEQLTTDIARGYGPTLAELSVILRIKAENRALFGATLQSYASELLPYANKTHLTKKRAAAFFTRMGDILRAEASLRTDLADFQG